jgi:hypothetical protein
VQGCQIFIGTTYQNGENIHYKIYKMSIKYLHIPKFSTPRPSKIHEISNFWYENITSGNPERVAIKLFAVPLAISINNNL